MMMPAGEDLLRVAMRHATAHPDLVDMGTWGRRATEESAVRCIAGWIVALGEADEVWTTVAPRLIGARMPDGRVLSVPAAAVELTGVDRSAGRTGGLFYLRDLDEAWTTVEALTAGRVSRGGGNDH